MSKINSAIIGHALGDVMGVPYEMLPRTSLKKYPIKGVRLINKYSDDTVMTLATMQAIADNEGKINYDDIMYEFYLWLSIGKYTQNGMPYGFGNTTFKAVNNYSLGFDALDCGINEEYANGNGALMRMLPIIFYLHRTKADEETIRETVKNATQLTHSHEKNIIGTYIFAKFCLFLLYGYSKEESYSKIKELDYSRFTKKSLKAYNKILKTDLTLYKEEDIKSGICIWETLEAVLWSVLTNNNFKDTILTALNLGGDTDTIGAITGGVAGLLYENEIPFLWKRRINGIKDIEKITKDFEKALKSIKC